VCGFSVGTNTDLLARRAGDSLGERLKNAVVVVENRLERNAMRWNRMRFHLIAFARTGDACCSRHDGSS
jgi:hypothetical protein